MTVLSAQSPFAAAALAQGSQARRSTIAHPAPTYDITVVGLGYVGAVLSASMAKLGHRICGVDVDATKRELIGEGLSPIHEAGLQEALSDAVALGRLRTSAELAASVSRSHVTFVCVGTPTAADGSCDDTYIRAAAREIGKGLRFRSDYHLVLLRCSVPPGTTMNVMVPEIEAASGKKLGTDFGVGFSPEFLREGVAMDDFMNPPKTLIGSSDDQAQEMMIGLNLLIDDSPIFTTIEEAEMVKYVDNVWHANKVCFANEVGRLCKSYGIDGHAVMDAFCQDTKLNLSPYYLKPGFAYGGSCLPKEVRAVTHLAQDKGLSMPLFEALETSNKAQIEAATSMVRAAAKAPSQTRVGILGLAFKPGTDDLRESPILEVMATLDSEGYALSAFDEAIDERTQVAAQLAYVENASQGLRTLAPKLKSLMVKNAETVAQNCDVLILTHPNPAYVQAARQAGVAKIIDLSRTFTDLALAPGYEGIGW